MSPILSRLTSRQNDYNAIGFTIDKPYELTAQTTVVQSRVYANGSDHNNGFQLVAEFDVEIIVEDCKPKKYGFNNKLPSNIDISFDDPFPDVPLPVGFSYQYLQSDGVTLDNRSCLTTYSPNLKWTIVDKSGLLTITNPDTLIAPTKISAQWSNGSGAANVDQTLQVEIFLLETTNGSTYAIVHSQSIDLTLKCSLFGQIGLNCPSQESYAFNMITENKIGIWNNNHRVAACANKIEYGCVQRGVTPLNVTYDLCKSSWFSSKEFHLASANNTADFEQSKMEYPAIYKLELSAKIGEIQQTCKSFDISVDLLDCSSGI